MRAQTKENVAKADELVVSQEDETQMRHSTHPSSTAFGSFLRRSWLEATPTEGLTETISYGTLNSAKQLLNDVVFIWFTDKNLFQSIKQSINLFGDREKLKIIKCNTI